MNITPEISYTIIQRLTSIMDYNINIMDEKGMIVASTDSERINMIHEGALHVLQSKQQMTIHVEDEKRLHGTKAGINLPIEFMDELVGVVGVTGDPKELEKLAQMTKITVELMLNQEYIQKQLQFKQQLMNSWVMELISPDRLDEKKLERNANHFLNIDIEKETAVYLIELQDLEVSSRMEDFIKKKEMKTDILQLIQSFFHEDVFLTFIDEDIIFIGVPLGENRKKEELQIAEQLYRLLGSKYHNYFLIQISIGNKYKEIQGIRRSYFEAKQSLVLLKQFQLDSPISHIKDWGLIRLLDNVPQTIRQELLLEYPIQTLSSELLITLNILFECDHNLALTAKKLHIHRNTLSYRLENIHQILNLNPKSVKDSCLLFVLTILNKLEISK